MNPIEFWLVMAWLFLSLFSWTGLMILAPRPSWTAEATQLWRYLRFLAVTYMLALGVFVWALCEIPGHGAYDRKPDIFFSGFVAAGPALGMGFVAILIGQARRNRRDAHQPPKASRTATLDSARGKTALALAVLWAPISYEIASSFQKTSQTAQGLGDTLFLFGFVAHGTGLAAIALVGIRVSRTTLSPPQEETR